MARPTNIQAKVRDIVNTVFGEILGDPKKGDGIGKLPMTAGRMNRLTATGRILAERPTRDTDEFMFIMDILANSPAMYRAVWDLAEDAALDEESDERAWFLALDFTMPEFDDEDDDQPTVPGQVKELTPAQKAARKRRKEIRRVERKLLNIFDDLAHRTDLGANTKHYIFEMLTAGDCFAELYIYINNKTGKGRIEHINQLPTWQTSPNRDEQGFVTGYKQERMQRDPDPIEWTIPQQIAHWKHQPKWYHPLGRSIFSNFKSEWEAFKIVAMDRIAAVHLRTLNPEIHYIGNENGTGVTDVTIKAYHQKLLDDPTGINRFYVVRQGKVKIEPLNTGNPGAIKVLNDLYIDFEGRLVTALGAHNPNSKTGARYFASSLDQRYARRIKSIRQDFTRVLYQIVLLEFALQGYDFSKPESFGVEHVKLRIAWPDPSETRLMRSKRVSSEFTVGLRGAEDSLRALGERNPVEIIERMKEERDAGLYPLTFSGGISNNGEQGAGTPQDAADANGDKQTKSVKPGKGGKKKPTKAGIAPMQQLVTSAVEGWFEMNASSIFGALAEQVAADVKASIEEMIETTIYKGGRDESSDNH